MATNRDLLKEAIADAKAVKETAIANAKAALEEAFTPYLKEKLASKINEMDEAEEMEEMMYDDAETMEEMKKKEDMMDEEVSLDELLAELDEESSKDDLYEAEKEEEEMSIEDMSEDDLKSFIEDVIKDMVEAGELEAGHEGMENEEGAEMEVDMEAGESEEGEEELEEEYDINELLAELDESDVNETEIEELTAAQSGAGISGDNAAIQAIAKALDKTADWVKKNFNAAELKQALKNIGSAAGSATMTGTKESVELNETIETLKSELNEINLLNAKLLYTNKIFRNKSLTESQKVKVLTAFDKATTKKEVELVYETLLESLKVSTTKAPIKESLGSASKVLGSATSKPIIENDAFARMRELAFGNKK
jgi:hypothetical protein